MADATVTKTCTKCGETKPLGQFRVDRSKPSGRKQPCKKCSDSNVIKWKKKHPAQAREVERRFKKKLRSQVLKEYGNACACCGEKTPEFLTIDHVHNDGAKHRTAIGMTLYSWLKRSGFPKDRFQLLCFNCNCAKGIHGECPHQRCNEKTKGSVD